MNGKRLERRGRNSWGTRVQSNSLHSPPMDYFWDFGKIILNISHLYVIGGFILSIIVISIVIFLAYLPKLYLRGLKLKSVSTDWPCIRAT